MFALKDTRPVWAEINLDNLAHNIKEVRRITNEDSIVTAVVKADGYGHGAKVVSEIFLKNGADRLAVATLSEALQLREDYIEVPLIILGYTPSYQFEKVINNNIIQTIYSLEQAIDFSKECVKLNKTGKIHIKVATGMSRIGFEVSEESIEKISVIANLKNVKTEGRFTHFAQSDIENKNFTYEQVNKFNWVIGELEKKGVDIPIKHVSNSAAIIDLKNFNMDMVRAGIMLYGLYPSKEVNTKNADLKPAMTLKAKISQIKTVSEGTGISYGHIYITKRTSKIATLPIGYADGFTRLLSNKTFVTVNGVKVPLVGRICMDQCMIDITELDNINIGDEVVLFGDGSNNSLHIDDIADILQTINYEVVCMIGKRVPRVYIKSDKVVNIVNYI